MKSEFEALDNTDLKEIIASFDNYTELLKERSDHVRLIGLMEELDSYLDDFSPRAEDYEKYREVIEPSLIRALNSMCAALQYLRENFDTILWSKHDFNILKEILWSLRQIMDAIYRENDPDKVVVSQALMDVEFMIANLEATIKS